MPIRDLPAAIADDEVLYRRIPNQPDSRDANTGELKELVFKPQKLDSDGLSLSRAIVGPEGAAATGPEGKQFYVAAI